MELRLHLYLRSFFPLMAVHGSLRALLRNPKAAKARSLLERFSASAIPFSFQLPLNPSSSDLRLTSSHSKIFTPWSRWIAFSGPLFLSAPAYMLSQSATPLYWPGEVVFQKPESLNLLQKRNVPIKLVFGSNPVLEHAVQGKELGGNGKTSSATVGDATDGFWNLPNLISMSRLVSGPFLGWMIINEWYFPAFVGLAISGATDWLDGFVARKMRINSVVGSYLDPLADKVLIGCVAVGMMKRELLHPGLVGLVLLRDVALVSGAFYKRAASLHWEWKSWSEFFNLDATRQKKVEPLFISKVNTVFQLVLVAAALLQPEFGTEETQPYITYLSWLVASTTGASWAAYGKQHMHKGLATGRRVFVSSNKP